MRLIRLVEIAPAPVMPPTEVTTTVGVVKFVALARISSPLAVIVELPVA